MIYFLYIFLTSFAVNHGLLDELVTSLIPSTIDTYVNGMDDFPAYEFSTSNSNEHVLSEVNLINEPLSSQYLVTAVFKTDQVDNKWCLFTIKKENNIIMNLCFAPVGSNTTRITLQSGTNRYYFSIDENFKDQWTNITFDISGDEANFRVNCKLAYSMTSKRSTQDITLTKDMELTLAVSSSNFTVTIQEIKLYTRANPDTIKSICNEGRSVFDITDYDDDYDYGDSTSAVLTICGKNLTDYGTSLRDAKKSECTCVNETFTALLMKKPELKGERGDRGMPGLDGKEGLVGPMGTTGAPGARGLQGFKGEPGMKGEVGYPGITGPAGPVGIPGKDGKPGKPGPIGLQGPTGPPGPPGEIYVETEEEKAARIIKIPGVKGDMGLRGPPGTAGEKGDPGEKGPKGDVGIPGEKGNKGHRGFKGFDGEKGEQGAAGIDGLQGPRGPPGTFGKRGEKGDKGSPGMIGLPASLTSLLYEEIEPKTRAMIVDKLRGIKGDRGETGEQGLKGDPGIQGLRGLPGKIGRDGPLGPQGRQGDKGHPGAPGHSGLKGDRGEPGPVGEVPESKIALLKGAVGEKGDIGLPGISGKRGEKGDKGDIGPAGSKGERGGIGYPGPVGPIGEQGLNGTNGDKGQKGECQVIDNKQLKGEKGEVGSTGKIGRPGRPGPKGSCAALPTRGSPGALGAPGIAGEKGDMGPPGLSVEGQKGEKGDSYFRDFGDISVDPNNEDAFYPVNTFVYANIRGFMKIKRTLPIGTLVYVIQERILLIKADDSGWNRVMMSPMTELATASSRSPTTMPTPSSTKPTRISTTSNKSRIPSKTIDGRKNIRLIALNQPYSGSINEAKEGADMKCHKQSVQLENKGFFKAFRASKIQYLKYLIQQKFWQLPVVNIHGYTLFDTWESMFNGSGARIDFERTYENGYNSIYSFKSQDVLLDNKWPKKKVWHGAQSNGNLYEDCKEWRSNSSQDFGTASSLDHNMLLDVEFISCDTKLIVLCVEISNENEFRNRRLNYNRNLRRVRHDRYIASDPY